MNTDSKNNETEQCTIPVIGSSVQFYTYHDKKDPYYKGRGKIVKIIKDDDTDEVGFIIKPDVKFTKTEKIFRSLDEITNIIAKNCI